MQVTTYKKISDVEKLWNKLYKSSMEMSFFQSFEWNVALEYNFYGKKEQYKGRKLLYVVFDECLILPLVINQRKKEITLLGHGESSDYLSFIYGEYNSKIFAEAILYVLNKFSQYKFILDKINQSNPLANMLQDGIDSIKITEIEKECVYVPTNNGSTSFYNSLSKSARQNYRTAKNRLKKDGHTYQVETEAGKVNNERAQQLYELYRARRDDCDSRSNLSKTIKKTLKAIVDFVLHKTSTDLLSYYAQQENVFLSEVYIDGELAAFCEGNYNNREDVISIARVATNSKYYIYSPGQILLIETIERIRNSVAYLDLTRGSEDYKFRLGGIRHINNCFTLEKI